MSKPAMNSNRIRRRALFQRAGIVGLGLCAASLAACAQQAASPTPAPAKPAAQPTPAPAKPTAAAATKPAAKAEQKPATQAPPKPQTMQSAKIAVITGVAEYAFALMGQEQNIYKNQGLNVEFVELKDGGTQLRSLLAGEIHMGLMGSGPIFASHEKGADSLLIGSAYPKLNFVMFAKPGIQSVKDLEGKSVGTASPGSFLHNIATALLEKHGVNLDRVNFVNIGSSPDVFKAVAAGKVDAGPSTIDWIPVAKKENSAITIADYSKELPDYLRVVMGTTAKVVKDTPALAQAMLTAVSLSNRYGLDHKQELVKYGVEQMGKNEEQMEFLHQYEVENRIVAPDAEIEPRWVEYTQKLAVDTGNQTKVLPFGEVTNLQFQKQFVQQHGAYKWR